MTLSGSSYDFICTESISSVFESQNGSCFDYVINCAAETKLGQTEAVSPLDVAFNSHFGVHLPLT